MPEGDIPCIWDKAEGGSEVIQPPVEWQEHNTVWLLAPSDANRLSQATSRFLTSMGWKVHMHHFELISHI